MWSGSKEFVKAKVYGPDYATIADDSMEMAIIRAHSSRDEPEEADYKPAEYVDGEVRMLVGPGSTFGELDGGDYWVFVRVTDSPEIPVMRAGKLKIT